MGAELQSLLQVLSGLPSFSLDMLLMVGIYFAVVKLSTTGAIVYLGSKILDKFPNVIITKEKE